MTSFFACCALLGTILLGGLAALIAVGDYFLFAQQRSGAVTILPVVWMLAAAVAGQSAWVDSARRRAFRRGLHVAVVLGFPLARTTSPTNIAWDSPQTARGSLGQSRARSMLDFSTVETGKPWCGVGGFEAAFSARPEVDSDVTVFTHLIKSLYL